MVDRPGDEWKGEDMSEDDDSRKAIALPIDYVTQPCGAKDPKAKIPEPAHYDCKECHRQIVALLVLRKEPEQAAKVYQKLGPWME